MSEKEKQHTTQVIETLNKLSAVKGREYTEGLIAGINIGTRTEAEAKISPANPG